MFALLTLVLDTPSHSERKVKVSKTRITVSSSNSTKGMLWLERGSQMNMPSLSICPVGWKGLTVDFLTTGQA